MIVFLSLSGLLFYLNNIQSLSGNLLTFLPWLTYLVMLLTPLLTMRLLCEERQKNTDQLLLTSPVSVASIVIAKYCAAACVMLLTIFLTNIFTIIILFFGKVYWGEWFVGYLGFTLQSLAFLSADLLVTSLASRQMTGAVAAYAANLVLYLLDLVTGSISVGFFRSILSYFSLYERYESFLLGQLSFSDISYYLLFIAVCLCLTIRMLDAKRFLKGGNVS
jgi:hypothetical protein